MRILLFQTFMNALMLAGLYSLVAAGLTLVFGVMHIVNFAHGAFLMLGAYGIYYLFDQFGIEFYTSVALAVVIAGLVGMLVERHLYHRYWGQVLPCLAVAVGLSQIMQNGALMVFGITDKSVDSIFTGVISLFGMRFSFERFMIIVISYVLIVALAVFLKTTKRGQAMRAVAQDYDAASLLGIKTQQIAMLAMFIGVGMAAAGGAIIGPVFSIHAYMGEFLMVKAFLIIVLGGLGSLPGAILGGLLIGFLESFGMTYLGYISQILLFVLVIIVLLVRPTGLFSGIVFHIR